jgi:sugar/nucleoside kinase (ribokinase family)
MGNKNFDIIAIGESLVDMIASVEGGEIHLVGNPGGGPANMLAAASRLGRRTAYITKVGDDVFGRLFLDAMNRESIDSRWMITDKALTTLAIVSIDATGDRDFAFYRNQTADVCLSADEVDEGLLADCRVLHYSTVSMTVEPARSANFFAATKAKAAGALLAFDPNYRAFLWPDRAEAVAMMEKGMALADFVKVSEEEATLLTGAEDPEKAGALLFERYHPALLAVTLGPEGAIAFTGQGRSRQASHALGAVDTTGAGDGFWGATLHKLLQMMDNGRIDIGGPKGIDETAAAEILACANAAGAIATTRKGGIPAMATAQEIAALVGDC